MRFRTSYDTLNTKKERNVYAARKKRPYRERPYFKIAVTALVVIFISILLVVIFTDLPGFFSMLKAFGAVLSPLITGCIFAFLLNPLVRFVDVRLCPALEKRSKGKHSPQKLSRAVSILFALIFAGLIIYAFFAMLLPQLYESIVGIVNSAEDYYKSIEKWFNKILADNPEIQSYADTALNKVFDYLKNWLNTSLLSDVQKFVATVTTSVISVIKWFANLFIGLVASIYILWSKDLFQAQAKRFWSPCSARRQPTIFCISAVRQIKFLTALSSAKSLTLPLSARFAILAC